MASLNKASYDMGEAVLEWERTFKWSVLIASIVTLIMIVILIGMFTFGKIKEVAENFPRYRCNPFFMPFAGNFGYEPRENFNYCLTSVFNTKAIEVFGPVFKLLSNFTVIIHLIVDVALGIRKLFSNFLFGVNNFVRSVRDRIANLFFNIRMMMLRMKHLMSRVYGSMISVIFMGTSAIAVGQSIPENGLVQFLNAFCFTPTTLVQLQSGEYRQISEIKIGDTLRSVDGVAPVVTSVFRFDGSHTDMVELDGVGMSANHLVHADGAWMPAGDVSRAQPYPAVPELICLNVTGHKFHVYAAKDARPILVADYDEHEGRDVVSEVQQIAYKTLNNRPEGPIVSDYSLGLDPTLEVRLEDGSWKSLACIALGDTVWNAGSVCGIVQEYCTAPVLYKGVRMASAQLVFEPQAQLWTRVGGQGNPVDPTLLYSILTSTGGTLHVRTADGVELFVRDYREVPSESMEEPYMRAVCGTKIEVPDGSTEYAYTKCL